MRAWRTFRPPRRLRVPGTCPSTTITTGPRTANNDPDSEFAMDPNVCPPSHNAGDHYAEEGYAGDSGYGYPGY